MMLLAVIGFLTGRPDFLDIAITYGLLNDRRNDCVLKVLSTEAISVIRASRSSRDLGD